MKLEVGDVLEHEVDGQAYRYLVLERHPRSSWGPYYICIMKDLRRVCEAVLYEDKLDTEHWKKVGNMDISLFIDKTRRMKDGEASI